MTIEERLDRLVERHEALTETVELLAAAQQKTEDNLKHLSELVTDFVVHTRLLSDTVDTLAGRVRKLEGK